MRSANQIEARLVHQYVIERVRNPAFVAKLKTQTKQGCHDDDEILRNKSHVVSPNGGISNCVARDGNACPFERLQRHGLAN